MRVSEVYASAQGEGPNVGRTTVFVRFGGCNLRCPGWPCDTQHAIDPAFRHDWEKLDPQQLVERATTVARSAGTRLITLTGGEPLLQKASELYDLTSRFIWDGYELDAFSNGTFLYPQWWLDRVTTIIDWKLPGSGEDPINKNRIDNVRHAMQNIAGMKKQAIKFVCKNREDFDAAYNIASAYHLNHQNLDIFYGRVWETPDITDAELVELVLQKKLPWRLNRQEHNYIWPAHERAR
jgi:7-carboxy-7-deazaguanine synthase